MNFADEIKERSKESVAKYSVEYVCKRHMHGSPALFFILLNVVAELGIHQRFFAVYPALLAVFNPQQLFVDHIPKQFLSDGVKVSHADRSFGNMSSSKVLLVIPKSKGQLYEAHQLALLLWRPYFLKQRNCLRCSVR